MQRGFSIVMAAHNEGAVIERTLRSVLANRLDRPLQVVVVANACRDDTTERARSLGDLVEVIESPIGNKVHALNIGDRAARYFPRAYMDADIAISPNTLQSLADAFDSDPSLRLASPDCRHLYTGTNPLLAGYYRLWCSLPYVRRDTMARGFFAIDEILRSRFDEFPSLTADDKFVRNLARPDERRIIEGVYSTVRMPATFADLLRVKTRWTYGNLELSQRRPDLNVNDANPRRGALAYVLRHPSLWPHMPTFLFVYVYSRLAARRRLRHSHPAWDRAESSRLARSSA